MFLHSQTTVFHFCHRHLQLPPILPSALPMHASSFLVLQILPLLLFQKIIFKFHILSRMIIRELIISLFLSFNIKTIPKIYYITSRIIFYAITICSCTLFIHSPYCRIYYTCFWLLISLQ